MSGASRLAGRSASLSLVMLACVACRTAQESNDHADRAATPAEVAPSNAAHAVAAPSSSSPGAASGASGAPSLDPSCKADADCGETDVDVAGPTACCPGCTPRFASNASIAGHRAWCASHMPSSCPAIGCAMKTPHPACVAGRCVDRP